jgi:hypothetical protein
LFCFEDIVSLQAKNVVKLIFVSLHYAAASQKVVLFRGIVLALKLQQSPQFKKKLKFCPKVIHLWMVCL